MQKYTVTFWNATSNEFFEMIEMERPRFTKREHDMIVSELFFACASQGVDAKRVTASVVVGKNRIPVYYEMECIPRVMEPSAVDAYLFLNGEYIRRMNICS